jgi:protein phosphatase
MNEPRPCDRRDDRGPFDVIGDVHGCADELRALLDCLGYPAEPAAPHPAGRRAVFVGDLVDRGPDTPAVVRLATAMVASGTGLCVMGNHDIKLARALRGEPVSISRGRARSLDQLQREPALIPTAERFLTGLPDHLVLDAGRLVVAHAGLAEELHGQVSPRVRSFALYGPTAGERDAAGHPVRLGWTRDYRGAALVVFGHIVVHEPRWANNTVDIDTGCVFGGRLTALRYPERELVSVPAARVYFGTLPA